MGHSLNVFLPDRFLSLIKEEKRRGVITILENDPRPSYIDDSERIYTFDFADYEISFKVSESDLTVTDVKIKRR